MAKPCTCCGYLTMSDDSPGTFDICPVCYWEDDNLQFKDSSYSSGANKVSLDEAKKNFKLFGACEKEYSRNVRRPLKEELP